MATRTILIADDNPMVRNALSKMLFNVFVLIEKLEFAELPVNFVLNGEREQIKFAYFINSGLASVLNLMSDGKRVEVGWAGKESFVGVPLPLELRFPPCRLEGQPSLFTWIDSKASQLCCIAQYRGEPGATVIKMVSKKKVFDAIFSAVMKEMAEPRLAASVRDRVVKFKVTDLLRNRDTSEDGRVSGINANNGVVTYEVWVPKDGNSWEGGCFISHWRESVLKLSTNARLRSSSKQLYRALNLMSLHPRLGK